MCTCDCAGGNMARCSRGVLPEIRPKLTVNEPTLPAPTAKQMSATDQSVVRSNAAARSSRRVSRYWCGDSPNARLNSRLKWAGDRPAAAARSGTVSGSAYLASARSLARSRWRASGRCAMASSMPAAVRPDRARGLAREPLELGRPAFDERADALTEVGPAEALQHQLNGLALGGQQPGVHLLVDLPLHDRHRGRGRRGGEIAHVLLGVREHVRARQRAVDQAHRGGFGAGDLPG